MSNFPMGPLGPCEVLWKASTLAGDITSDDSLGYNMEVTFESSDDTAPVKTAQHGTGNYDEIYTGTSCTATVQLTVTTLAQLESCSINSSIVVTGDELMVNTVVGTSMRDYAGALILKKQTGTTASADEKEWLTVFKAAPRRNLSLTFNAEGQRIYEMVFVGFPVLASEVTTDTNTPNSETYAADALWAVGYGQTS